MQSTSNHSCLPRVIALYILIWAASEQLLPLVHEYLSGQFVGWFAPPLGYQVGVYAQSAILLIWLPLSYFVWRRRIWARPLVAYPALGLVIVRCVNYVDALTRLGSALLPQMVGFALPAFFLSAVMFCPTVGQSFAAVHAGGTKQNM